jgi:hypothetical protein
MDAAVRYVVAQCSVNQLLLFDRAQALEDSAYCRNIVMVTLTLHVEFTFAQMRL